jgi:hypothetical protein
LVLISFVSEAQSLFKMSSYRNYIYASGGYNGSFGNATVGIARRDSFRLIKKEVIGIIDISVPISNQFFTKHLIRKAFQFDLYANEKYRIPFVFASSSILRKNQFYKIEDITAEITINPGIYREKYTLALDLRYELVVFRHIKYSKQYLHDVDNKALNHWNEPLFDILKFGVVGGLNFKRVAIYMKTGYEENPFSFKKYFPGYVVLGVGYKYGTKPMKKEK